MSVDAVEDAARPHSHRRRSSKSKYETTIVQNTVALAVIDRLRKCATGGEAALSSSRQKTLRDVRRNIVNSTQRRCKSITDLELQLLRHLTCPQSAIHRPLRPTHKKRTLSRPPSPNLFDIFEADEPMD
ncbi:hypothetical protein M3Y99_00197400 [Aphelenchoides fujianensis]|nr:hypothetical protein M3Y99_00197400 [Aphelenchoides fujianensis]